MDISENSNANVRKVKISDLVAHFFHLTVILMHFFSYFAVTFERSNPKKWISLLSSTMMTGLQFSPRSHADPKHL